MAIANGISDQKLTIASSPTFAALTLTSPLAVTNGGTGLASTTANQILYSSATSTIAGLGTLANGVLLTNNSSVPSFLANGTAGFVLTANTGAPPSWQAAAAGTVTSVSGTSNRITSTGGATPVIDISASYVGQSSITTLGTIGTGVWQGTLIGGTYGGTGVNNGASTITLGGSLTTSGSFASTFTMTGITGVTFPTSGTLATTSQIPSGAALTKTDDTNVTLTLGGSPTTALVNAASLTLGWTGQLGLTRGGTAASLTASNGGIIYSTASAMAVLSGTATATQMLQSGASGAPAWSTTTWPATSTANQILYSSATNTVTGLATLANGVLVTNNSSVPSLLANSGTAGFVLTANSGAPPSWQAVSGTGTVNSGTSGQLAYYATTGTAVSGLAMGTGVLTALGNNVTGSGGISLTTSPTFVTNITTPTAIFTGATNTNKQFTANSGSAITIDPANGAYQTITLTANTTITLTTVPTSTTENEFMLELVQDGTGSRTVTWANITFATGGGTTAPVNSAIGSSTYFGISGTNSAWIGYTGNNIGSTNASVATAGYIGEVISSSVAIGSAVSMTTATGKTITSIALTPGDWLVWGNIGYIAAATTIPTLLTNSISATNNTQATSPNGGGFSQLNVTFVTASTNIMTIAPTEINISAAATYYLVGTATFTVSTLTAYGSITAMRFR